MQAAPKRMFAWTKRFSRALHDLLVWCSVSMLARCITSDDPRVCSSILMTSVASPLSYVERQPATGATATEARVIKAVPNICASWSNAWCSRVQLLMCVDSRMGEMATAFACPGVARVGSGGGGGEWSGGGKTVSLPRMHRKFGGSVHVLMVMEVRATATGVKSLCRVRAGGSVVASGPNGRESISATTAE